MFRDFFLDRQLSRLEREANDDLLQIMEFGPRPYTTLELKQLLRRIKRESAEVVRLQQRYFLAGSCTVLLVGISFLCAAIGWDVLGIAFVALAPAGLIIFAGGSIFLNRRYRTYKHSRVLEKAILEELERRRKDASIF